MENTKREQRQKNKNRNRQVPNLSSSKRYSFSNYSFLALFLLSVMIILLDFVNIATATINEKRDFKIDLHGICVADVTKLGKLKIGGKQDFDVKISFPSSTKSYSPQGYAVPITIDVNKDRIDAMLIYAYGKGNSTLRVGSWDSTKVFNWDVECGSSIGEQNATLITVADGPVTSTTLTWYPPSSPGNGDVNFKALVINKDKGYDIITSGPLTDSTSSVATTSSTVTTTSSKVPSSTTKNPNSYKNTTVARIDTGSANSNKNFDSNFIIITFSSTFLVLLVSLPLINVMLL